MSSSNGPLSQPHNFQIWLLSVKVGILSLGWPSLMRSLIIQIWGNPEMKSICFIAHNQVSVLFLIVCRCCASKSVKQVFPRCLVHWHILYWQEHDPGLDSESLLTFWPYCGSPWTFFMVGCENCQNWDQARPIHPLTPCWDGLVLERKTKNNTWTSPAVNRFLADVRLSAGLGLGLPWSQHSRSWLGPVNHWPIIIGSPWSKWHPLVSGTGLQFYIYLFKPLITGKLSEM